MQITLNGQPYTTDQETLTGLLLDAGYENMVVATALDQQFVAKEQRASTTLKEGCEVDVVAPMQGG